MTDRIQARETVAELIRKSFPVNGVPRRQDLIRMPRQDELEIIETFVGRMWPDLKTEELRYNAEAICLFTPQALAYYLPAFMIACLLDESQADIVAESLCFSLTPRSESLTLASCIALRALLTGEQGRAIAMFLNSVKHARPSTCRDYQSWLEMVEKFWTDSKK